MISSVKIVMNILIIFVSITYCFGIHARSLSLLKKQSWSEQGVFVFQTLVFDFKRGRYSAIIAGGYLSDCSNADWYCMDSTKSPRTGEKYELILPRHCDVVADTKPGDVWSVGGVRTKVLRIDRQQSNTTLYLGSPALPHAIYIYSKDNGVVAMIRTYRDIDLTALVAAGDLDNEEIRINRTPLSTFDPFGKCSA